MARGQASLYIVFLFLAFIIIIVGAIAAPIGARFSAEMFTAGANLLNDTRMNPVSQIDDPALRAQMEDLFDSATAAQSTNVEVSTGIYQYSWVIILILTAVVLFLVTRSLVAFSQRGGGVV